jgi:hypothetical protein
MPNLGLGINIQSGAALSPFNAEYQAVLNYARTNNYTLPSPTEQLLQNQLIADLKTSGIWAKLDAFYMFANSAYSGVTYDGSSFARINWKNPTANYGTAAVNLPSISAAAGYTGSAVGGSNQGINLNFTPSTQGVNFANPNASFGVMLGTVSTATNSPIMGATGFGNNYNRIRQSGTSSVASNPFDPKTFTDNQFIHVNRYGNNAVDTGQYVNGTRTQGFSTGSFLNDANGFYVLRYGDAGTGYGNSQVKAAFIGGDLSGNVPNVTPTVTIPNRYSQLINSYITNLNSIALFATYAAMAKETQYTVI